MRLKLIGLVAVVTGSLFAGCQRPAHQPKSSPEMDTRFLRDYSETWGFSAGHPTGVHLTPDGEAVLFLRSGPRDVVRNLYEMNTATGEVRGLIRAADLLAGAEEKLTVEEKARRERAREIGRGFTWYSLSEDGEKILTGLSGRLYVIQRKSGEFAPLRDNPAGTPIDARFSPDGRYVSCIRSHDLYVTDLNTLEEKAVTTGGTADVTHGVAEFVAQEEMHRRTGYWWSGDAQWLAFEECDQREVEMLYIADARNPGQPPQSWRYPRAGRTNAKVRLGIVSVTGGEPKWVDWDRETYPYLAAVHWGKDAPLTVYVQDRQQRNCVLYLIDHSTGATTELLRETDAAWVNIDPDMPRWLDDGNSFLWTSERTGERQLEWRSRSGELIKTFGLGDARLYGVSHVNPKSGEIILSGGNDPTETNLYRLSLKNGELAVLTQGAGSHDGVFCKAAHVWVDKASLPDGSYSTMLRARDGRPQREIPSVAEEPPFAANVELTTVRSGGQNYHAAIVRPREFDRSKKYPVIDYVYGGPGHPVVTSASRAYLRQQWIADQGFIVVSVDGRGTPRRGREWERAISWNLIDIPLEDQVAGVQALGARYGEMDMTRVGIYGWSFGGYFAAMATCRRPDVFHAAIAGAPVIDWEDYDTHYTERYMGLPQDNPEGYKKCSVLTYAEGLSRPLLLIHGTTDDNVYFVHTLKMAEALFRAGKPCDLLVLPGFTHMVPDPLISTRLYGRIMSFLAEHLQSQAASN